MRKQLRLDQEEITPVLESVLRWHGFSKQRVPLCARLFVEASLDGIYSHGLNRFPQFIGAVAQGTVKPANEPSLVHSSNNFENWDGNLGPGNLNAWASMHRAIQLAKSSGMGAVSLRNTNHWMRGGNYGLQAANAACIGICMTNTKPNMPPWGGRGSSIGNNPFIIAVPNEPYPFLLDMAMSQFSYGKMEVLEKSGAKLPFAGGFDTSHVLTDDPGAIIESELALPMGYWKGSGLALLIDLLVSSLSGGLTSREIGGREEEYGVSQLFIAFDLEQLADGDSRARVVNEVSASLLETAAMEDGGQVYYPGQRSWQRRQENERDGIPVDHATWDAIMAL
ncbi:MAG: 3-dehydro-L-gulonate 2-dehydrogenase [Xanthomonadales bacterium]|jgi:3-dehydro-L-gulonate 2-dehydrogenase|nr:3-dehydro-L-gulonate 2-dehydrogenase [Xanthomonadales bacterium]